MKCLNKFNTKFNSKIAINTIYSLANKKTKNKIAHYVKFDIGLFYFDFGSIPNSIMLKKQEELTKNKLVITKYLT
jgi:hypothetical protein